MVRLGIVVVSYRSDDETVAFVRDGLSGISVPHLTVVVDNGATEAEASGLQERIPDATVLRAENLGYARGNNLGVVWLLGNGSPEYILISNNDVELTGDGVVEALMDKADAHPEAAVFGPAVVGPDGDFQSPEPYMGLWKRYVWMYLSTPFLSSERKRELFFLDYARQAQEGLHYRLSGSFFLVRTADFVRVGLFDPQTFLYGEECILSERLSHIGKGCYYCPDVRVIHRHGETVRRHIDDERSSWTQCDSMACYYRDYRGYARVEIRFVRLLYRLILKIRKWRT